MKLRTPIPIISAISKATTTTPISTTAPPSAGGRRKRPSYPARSPIIVAVVSAAVNASHLPPSARSTRSAQLALCPGAGRPASWRATATATVTGHGSQPPEAHCVVRPSAQVTLRYARITRDAPPWITVASRRPRRHGTVAPHSASERRWRQCPIAGGRHTAAPSRRLRRDEERVARARALRPGRRLAASVYSLALHRQGGRPPERTAACGPHRHRQRRSDR